MTIKHFRATTVLTLLIKLRTVGISSRRCHLHPRWISQCSYLQSVTARPPPPPTHTRQPIYRIIIFWKNKYTEYFRWLKKKKKPIIGKKKKKRSVRSGTKWRMSWEQKELVLCAELTKWSGSPQRALSTELKNKRSPIAAQQGRYSWNNFGNKKKKMTLLF